MIDLTQLSAEDLDAYIARRGWTPEQIQSIIHSHYDHSSFCQRLTIRRKDGVAVPVTMTPAQQKLSDLIERLQQQRKPVRITILKARQVHMSVGCATWGIKQTAFLPGQRAYVFTHRQDSTAEIYGYYQQFTDSYDPTGGGMARLNVAGRVKHKSIRFDGGGEISFGTAGSTGIGRGGSRRFLHLSEVAFWPANRAAELRTGLFQTVPDDEGTMVLEESTANGRGGAFYESFWRAYDPAGDSDWAWMFYAWWEHPEYTRPVHNVQRFQESLSKDERELMTRYDLTLEQLHWRRWAIVNKCEHSVDRFKQEYPACPEEAFLTSGRPRFSLHHIARMPTHIKPLAGELEMERHGTRHVPVLRVNEDGRGALRVWQKPERSERYVIGADSASGIDVGLQAGKQSDPDFAVAQVLKVRTGEQVACLRERITPGEFGSYVFDLAGWYNDAYIVPESNNDGVAMIQRLLDLDIPLWQIFVQPRPANDRRPPQFAEYGWRTTTTTRPQLIHALDQAIRENALVIYDAITRAELDAFVIKPDGRAEAATGSHDDTVLALALAIIGLRAYPHAVTSNVAERNNQPKPLALGRTVARQRVTMVNGVRIR